MELDSNSATNENSSNESNNTILPTSNKQPYANPATNRLISNYDINVVRLIGQHLNSLGLKQTVELLLRETGVTSLDHPLAERIQTHILEGEFDAASSLVEEMADLVVQTLSQTPPQSDYYELLKLQRNQQTKTIALDNAIAATPPTETTTATTNSVNYKEKLPGHPSQHLLDRKQIIRGMKLAIAEQKYLELLEEKQTMEALKCLQSEITPNTETNNADHLPFLATLIFCRSTEDLKQRANWPGKGQQSRQLVIERLRNHVPPFLLLPARRLATLLNQAAQLQRSRCAFHLEQDVDGGDILYPNDLSATSNINNESNENHSMAQTSNGSVSAHDAYISKQSNGHCATATATTTASSSATPSSSSSSMSLDVASNLSTNHLDLVRDHVCSAESFPMQKIHDYDNHKSEVWFCQFSHDGLKLATGGVGGRLRIWQLDPIKQELTAKCTLDCPSFSISCLSWSPDDVYLLACGMEERSDLWVFNINKKELHNTIHHSDSESYTTCSWHMNGKRFAAASLQGNFHLYDLDGNRLGSREGVRVQCLSFLHKDPKYILAADIQNRIRAYSLEDMCKNLLDDRDVIEESFPIISFTISSDDKYIAVNLQSQGVHLWDYQTMTLMRVYNGVSQRNMAIFSSFSSLPGSIFLASGSEDGNVYIYHINKPDRPLVVLTGHSRCVNCVTWNPRFPQFLVSVSDDRLVTLWGPGCSYQNHSQTRSQI